MHLEQLNLTYLVSEDRILLRIGFSNAEGDLEKQEILLFITRRMLQRWWPTMLEAMAAQIRIDRPEAAFASKDLMQMEYQNSVNSISESGAFAQTYDPEGRTAPLGDKPLLLESIQFHLKANHPLCIQFTPQGGGNVDLNLNPTVLHGFCKLLQNAEKSAEWGLDLSTLPLEESTVPAHLLN